MPQNPLTGIGSRRAAIRIAGLYVVLGLAWIWLSDWALNLVGFAADGAFLAGAVKGTAFVVFTAGLLYGLVRREVSAIEESERLLRAVLNGTSDAVFVKDHQGRVLLANKAALQFMGRTESEVIGHKDSEFLKEKMDEMR